MASGRPFKMDQDITRHFKCKVQYEIQEFIKNKNLECYTFPISLTNVERKFIHNRCVGMGLTSKSHGSEPNRAITVYKPKHTLQNKIFLQLAHQSIQTLLDVIPECRSFEQGYNYKQNFCPRNVKPFGRLHCGIPVGVQKANPPTALLNFRRQLPTWGICDLFLRELERNQVVMVTSETGSGKTTQIPQFILDQYCETGASCKIICTQPRRLSTIAVAERVAAERGEEIGNTVGYQIKLESRLGTKSSLIYCTNGVLLRTLMTGDQCLQHMTHIIVDEVHERDKFTDFLLICLRECLCHYQHLKLILMSATMDTGLFKSYFPESYQFHIPGKLHRVDELFLDTILSLLNYNIDRAESVPEIPEDASFLGAAYVDNCNQSFNSCDTDEEMDVAIEQCVRIGSEDTFSQLMQLILSESASFDHQSSGAGYTPLMAAAIHGNMIITEQLLNMGADTRLKCTGGYTALDWAKYYNKSLVHKFLEMYNCENGFLAEQVAFEDQLGDRLVRQYCTHRPMEIIDYDLIVKLICYIHKHDKAGTILVFLPGYEEIMACQESIVTNSNINDQLLQFFILHGSIPVSLQREVFKIVPRKQKIILSTNIAETSITIDDVVYVIDSGLAKEKTYDAISSISSLQVVQISKACVKQRAGRAGRTRAGICYHLFSKKLLDSMAVNSQPEILRVPLHELCLHTKLLAPPNISIVEFLNLALEPPSANLVSSSIQVLKSLGALDAQENLTALGEHLLQLSIEPHLGKMLIYAVIFKCIDPVLSIVSCLSHKEPFTLPRNHEQASKKAALTKRTELAANTFSDHMSMLRAFQQWEVAKMSRRERAFCRETFINGAAMEMILDIRSQLVKQLRAAGFINNSTTMQDLNSFSESWPMIKAALAAGLYPQVAFVRSGKISTRTEKSVNLNRSSVLFSDKKRLLNMECCIVYEELARINLMCSIKNASVVTPLTIALTCGQDNLQSMPNSNTLLVDNWLEFDCSRANGIPLLRKAIEEVITRRIQNPTRRFDQQEDLIIRAVLDILTAEDAEDGFVQPSGIGQAPKRRHVECSAGDKFMQALAGSRNNHQSDRRRNHNENLPPRVMNNQRYEPMGYNRNDYGNSGGGRNVSDFQNTNRFEMASFPNGNRCVMPSAMQDKECIYFIIKPASLKNVQISIRNRNWIFSPQTERKIFRFFNDGYRIILFFTVQRSQQYEGIATLTSTNGGDVNNPCNLCWISTSKLSFDSTSHVLDAYACEDGFQIVPSKGQQLYNMFTDHVDNLTNPFMGKRPILGTPRRY